MQKQIHYFCLLPVVFCLLLITSCKPDPAVICPHPTHASPTGTVSKIAFGSCSYEQKDQPILYTITDLQPDIFAYLGDNIYGDTEDMSVLQSKYGLLSCKPEFQNLLASVYVIATWDDHDYGDNDAGLDYPMKEESKQIFLDFWNESALSERRNHPGIYTSYYYGDSLHRVQIILLDCRTFRSLLIEDANGDYAANYDSSATMLGSEQWAWLKNELMQPAKVRIIGSSTQFGREHNGYEAWANFPLQQQKMFQTIRDAQASGVVFMTGDVHIAELSVSNEPDLYPVYDITSSGLTQLEGEDIPNANRVGNAFLDYNFGMIEIDWLQPDPLIHFKAYGLNGDAGITHSVNLSEISF